MIANQLPFSLQSAQGHAFQSDVLAKHGVSVRTPEEMQAITDEHARIMRGRLAQHTVEPDGDKSLNASRRKGKRALNAANAMAAAENN